ncbi:hypothetical protein OROHE_007829 [Orobanche hederae]
MGNAALCAPSIIFNGGIKIFSGTDGKLLIYTKVPTKTAEIMLENPGHFLCESSNLRVGRRIPGMSADEGLERGHVYFLLPMEMLYSVLTDEEMMKLVSQNNASKGMRQAVSSSSSSSSSSQMLKISKIFPAEFNCLFPNINGSQVFKAVDHDDDDNHHEDDYDSTKMVVRYSRQRSWQPALETIIESTPPHV